MDNHIVSYLDAERREIPDGAQSVCHKQVGRLLGVFHRYGEDADFSLVLLLAFRKFGDVVDGNAADFCAHNFLVNIEACHDVQSELHQSGVLNQCGAEASCADHESGVVVVESEEI